MRVRPAGLTRLCLYIPPRIRYFRTCTSVTCAPGKHSGEVFFETIVIKQPHIVLLCVLGCAVHLVTSEKTHNYMLTPEHRALYQPLNPISQLAVLHPEHC